MKVIRKGVIYELFDSMNNGKFLFMYNDVDGQIYSYPYYECTVLQEVHITVPKKKGGK